MDYNKAILYKPREKDLVAVLDNEVVVFQHIVNSLYIVSVNRKGEDLGESRQWSFSAKKKMIQMLSRLDANVYTAIDDNFDKMTRFLLGLGFRQLSDTEFLRSKTWGLN